MKLNSVSIGAILGGVFAITVLLLGSTTCVIIVIVKLVVKKGTIWMLKLLSYRLFIVLSLDICIGSTKPGSLRRDLRYIIMLVYTKGL